MKPTIPFSAVTAWISRTLLCGALFAITLFTGGNAQAQSDTWTGPSGTTSSPTSGTWDNATTGNWSTAGTWGAGDTAVFGGTSSANITVTVGDAISANTLQFTSTTDNYTLSASSAQTITLSNTGFGASGGGIQIANGATATIGSNVAISSSDLGIDSTTSSQGGTLNIAGGSVTSADYIVLDNATVSVGTGGTLTANSGSGDGFFMGFDAGANNSNLTLNGGTLNVTNGVLWVGWSQGTSTFTINSGTANLYEAGIGWNNNGETGIINLAGGTLNVGNGLIGGLAIGSTTATSQMFFNGGTLVATSSGDTTLIAGFTGVYVGGTSGSGGAVVNNGGFAVGITNGLLTGTGVSGSNAGATDGGLVSSGAGTLTLTGVSTYTGGTTISAGTLAIGGAGDLGDSGGNGSYAGAIANSGTFNYNSSAAQTLSGNITGGGAIIQSGSGILTLSGSNTYTGTTTVNGGQTLSLQANAGNTSGGVSAALGSGTLVANSGSSTVQLLSNSSVTFSGTSGTGGYNSTGAFQNSTVTFNVNNNGSGSNQTISFDTGGLTFENSTLDVTGAGNGYTLALGTMNGDYGGGPYNTTIVPIGASVTIAGFTDPDNLILDGTSTGNSVGAITSGAGGGVTKQNTSTWTLTGNNTYTGNTAVNGGTLILTGSNTAVTGTTTVGSGAILQLQANAGNTTGGVSAALGTGTLDLTSGNSGVGTLQLLSNSSVTFSGTTGLNGFNGTGSIQGGTVTFNVNNNGSGSNQTISFDTGGIDVVSATVDITGGNGYTLALGTVNSPYGGGAFTTSFVPTSASVTIAGINGDSGVVDLDGTSTGNSVTGTITDNSSTTLVKSNTSIWTLSGNNTYAGGTTVSAGTLYVNNTSGSGSGTGTGAVTVAGGATLAGTGVIRPTISGAGILMQANSNLTSGGVPPPVTSGAVAGKGLTLDNTVAAGTILDASIGSANLTFSLGAGNNGINVVTNTPDTTTGQPQFDFANPNTDSTYMTVLGNTASEVAFATGDTITVNDLTGVNNLQLSIDTPYLLIQAGTTPGLLSDNNLYSGLVTTGGVIGGQLENGYVLNLTVAGTAASENYATRLYLFNGDLEVVPEPSTWAMMLGGLGLLLIIQTRRRRNN